MKFNFTLNSKVLFVLVGLFTCSLTQSFAQTTVYTTDFDSGDEGWTDVGVNPWLRAANMQAAMNNGATGNFWGFPNDGADYDNNEDATINSPIIDMTGFYNMTFSIDIRYNTGNNSDGFHVEYSDDAGANWFELGAVGEGTNWYTDNSIVAFTNVDVWENDNGAWQTATITLPCELDNNPQAQFRVHFGSSGAGTDDGVAFDNVIITSEIQTIPTPSVVSVPGDATETFLLWLQADSAALTNFSNGINRWGDWSGNNNVATAVGCGPTYTADAVNGHAAVSFDGVSNYMDAGDILNFTGTTDSWSLFVAYNTNTAAGTLVSRAGGGAGSTRQYQLGLFGGNFVQIVGGGTLGTGSAGTGSWQIVASLTSTSNTNTFLGGAADITSGAIGSVVEPSENFLLGARNGGASDFYTGDVAEVIAFLGELSTSKRRDVETYLAVKYGITLDISTQDYTVGGVSIFDNTNFSGYSDDIAGIGLDISQGLNQTVAESVTGNIVRVSNANDLDDGEFFVWGHDNGVTTTTTAQTPAGVDNRIRRIWRVSETGDAGTVDISFDINTLGYEGRTFNLLTLPSGASLPSGLSSATVSTAGTIENIDNVDYVTFSNINLSDQQYFTLGVSDAITGPGDFVTNLALWLRADLGVTHSNNAVSDWADQSGNNNDATEAGTDFPSYVTNAINGNPVVEFNDNATSLEGSFTNSDGDWTFFLVGLDNLTGVNSDDAFFEFRGGAGDDRYWFEDSRYASTTDFGTAINQREASVWTIEHVGSVADIFQNGTSLEAAYSTAGTGDGGTGVFNYVLGDDDTGGNELDGQIAEFLAYTSSSLTNAQIRDIETYLALKYGVTLDISATGYTVGGSAIYNNPTYSNSIAGIIRDDSQGLNQTSSKSVSGQEVEIGNPSSLDEGDYLIWGHDGAGIAFNSGDVPAGVTNRITQIWTVVENNDVGTVDLTFDLAGIGVQAGSTYQLIIANSTTMSSGSVTSSPTISGSLLTFAGVNFTDGQFFTLGVDDVATSPGDVSTNLSLWLDAGRGVTLNGSTVSQWADQGGGANFASQSLAEQQPTFVADDLNGNPVFSYDGGDVLQGDAGFYSVEYFVVTEPSEIYNSGESTGSIVGFEVDEFARLGLGPTSGLIANEVITHSAGNGGYRGAFTSTTANLNQPALMNGRSNLGATAHDIFLNGINVRNAEAQTGSYTNYSDTEYDIGDEVNSAPRHPYNGTVAEVISYSVRLSDDDRRDVATYLAIKYGITLDITAQAYTVGGVGNPIYPLASAYDSDIAGIGVNTSSALNQTSSKSVNSGSIVRMESASAMADGEFLVWGNDGAANTFTTLNVPPGVIEMLNKVWQVDETGDVGTVTVSFDITSLGLDIDNSTINLITMATGNTVPDDFDTQGSVNSAGIVTNVDGRDIVTFTSVDFTDLDFFTIGGDIQTASPGGSNALAMWFRGDQGVTSSGGLVSSWADQSGNSKDIVQGATVDQPTLVSDAINFNDAVQFTGGDNLETIDGFYTDEYFMVIKPDVAINNTATNGYVLGFEAQQSTGFFIGDENFIGSDLFGQTLETDNYDISAITPTSVSNDNVIVFNVRNNADAGPTAQEMFANGTAYTETTAGTHADLTDNPFRIGDNFDNDRSYSGLVAEVLSYSARLTTAQRRDVESYLALKYGITLDVSTENYTADAVDLFTYTGHDFDIAGLGKHLDYGLDQTQSVSQNTGAIVKMESLSDLDDDEYLIWGYDGDTGGSKTDPDANEKPAEFDERLPAEWRVAVTGSPGTVTVKVYVGGITNFSDRPQTASLYSLLLNNVDDFTTITSSVAASSLANDTLSFTGVSFADGDRFTLALPSQPDLTGLTLWLKADTDVEEGSANAAESGDLVQFWRDQSGNSNDFDQATFAVRPTYNTNQLNGNAVVTFDDANTYLDLATTNLNPRSIFIVYSDASTDANTTPFTNDDNDDGLGIGYGGTTNIFDASNTPADVRNGDNFVDGTDIGDGTTQARPANYELHSRVFVSNLSDDAAWTYYVGNDRGNVGTSIGGGVAEILVYTTSLATTARRDVESYLALKYGITLDITALNYTYNSGTSIFGLGSYSNDIAGIGSNSTYGFSQSSSTSNNSDAIVTVTNPSSLASGDFLVWGNDNGVTGETSTTVPPGIGMRVTRIWGVNETNDIGTVNVAFDLTGLGYGAKTTSELSLIVDANTDFSDGVLRTYSAQSFTSEIVTFTGVDFTGATNFGLGTTVNLTTDTDTDGIPDYFESAFGTNFNDGDDPVSGGSPNTDVSTTNGILGDGISDALEQILVTNGATAPITIFTDTDGDGIPDHIEVDNGSNPFSADAPTSGGNNDTDGDGIPDGLEALITAEGGPADPSLTTDTDSDGVPDYYEVINGNNPNDVNDPFLDGGSDDDGNIDGDGISDALEEILENGGANAPLSATTDTDGDGIPDYVEAQTFTDPFNLASPVAGVNTVRSLQADFEASGGQCVDLNGYQWVDVTDLSGNLVFSINPFGNNLGTTCWGVRVLSGSGNVRDDGGSIYYLNRNWYIEPTTQPVTNVYVRFYALDQEATDLTSAVNAGEGSSLTTTDILNGMVILKVDGDMELDPLVTGGGSSDENPTVVDFSVATADVFVLGLSSFSTFDPHVDASSPLPIELISFSAENAAEGVNLNWSTATELNNDFFTIERSLDGETFTDLVEIDGAGNSSSTLSYEFTDTGVSEGIYFYRLKQTDFDGKGSYSEIIAIYHTTEVVSDQLKLYPNPVNGETFYVSTENLAHGIDFEVSILDLGGRAIKSQLLRREFNNVLSVDVSGIENGVYVIRLRSEQGSMEAKIVIDK
ncbi:MAG: T9SS type A sorting domain-containing protein [Cyclobacteriaceae bacterium]